MSKRSSKAMKIPVGEKARVRQWQGSQRLRRRNPLPGLERSQVELTCSWVPQSGVLSHGAIIRAKGVAMLPTASRNPVSLLSGNLEQ